MKPTAIITILILIAGSISGWVQSLRLKELEKQHSQILSEARKLGWNQRTAERSSPQHRKGSSPNRPVADPDARIRQLSARLQSLAKQETDLGGAFGPQSSAGWQTLYQLMARTLDWDEASLCKLLDSLETDPEFRGTFAAKSIGFLMQRLADKAPMAALERAVAAVDTLNSEPHLREIVGRALATLATQNPVAALAWFRSHQNGHETLGGHSAAVGLIMGLSKSDPAAAFSLVVEGHPASHHQRIGAVIMGAKTPEQHREVLASLRGYLATMESSQSKEQLMMACIEHLAHKSSREGFAHSMKWLATMEMEPAEFEAFANKIIFNDLGADSGLWFEWMATNLPPRHFEGAGGSLIDLWTNRNHQQVREWLMTLPENSAQLLAVSKYASTVVWHNPEDAARVLMSISDEAARHTAIEPALRNLSFYHPDKAARFVAELKKIQHPSSTQTD
jgi:hypothetical protein